VPVRGPAERVAAAAGAALRANAHLLVGLQDVQGLLERLEPTQPALVREVSRQLPSALLAEVLRLLLEEGVSIRPLRQILEALLDAAPTTRSPPALAECCRRALRRHIVHHLAPEGALEALLLDPAAEAALRAEAGALDPQAIRTLLEMLAAELGARAEAPVVLAAGDVRRTLRQIVAPRFPRVAVLSYDELPATLPVRPVGKLALCA
jgi:type III secretion protein V